MKLTEQDVEFSLEVFPEEMPFEGNASAIDPDTDAATEAWIRKELESGNIWAWCWVRVTARWEGLEASDSLGGCSYQSEEDFTQPGGYYDDMKHDALNRLQEKLDRLAQKICR